MKNKKGKKLVVLGAMAALLTLIGVSGSQTYAKYVESTDIGSQHATVAKWGYVVSENVENLFSTQYNYNTATGGDNEGQDKLANVSQDDSALTVKASVSAGKIVAPGTEGYLTIDFDGFAEVDAMFSFEYSSALTDFSDIYLDDYHPMKWTLAFTGTDAPVLPGVGETGYPVGGYENNELKTLLDFLAAFDFSYQAGANSDTDELDCLLTLSWKWEFHSNEATDIKDTKLAVLATGLDTSSYDYSELDHDYAGKYSTEVKFNLTINIEQTQNA